MPKDLWGDEIPESRFEKIAQQDPLQVFKRAAKQPSDGITIGENLTTGLDVQISPKEHLSTHMHIVGSTGVGKSFFLENIIKSLINAKQGVCLITPHDELYRRLISYCAWKHRKNPELDLARRVIPLDVSEEKRVVGFNPVARNARDLSYQVIALMEAIRKCWGQDNFQETPRLARWLYNTGYGVVEPGLTMLQAQTLVDSKPNPIRDAIVHRIKDRDIKAEWQWIMERKMEFQDDRLESSFNRLREFTSNSVLRLMIGQQKRTIDIPAIMRDRKILLVNLDAPNMMGETNQSVIGTLLVNEILTAAFARPESMRSSFFLAVDEFQHFATKDMCAILDGGRKYGLHLILAHQFLKQLMQKSPEVYYSVMANARTKVVFGGLMNEDLDIMGKELYVGELDPNKRKLEIWHTTFEPVESSRLVVSESEAESESDAHSNISHLSMVNSEMFIPDSDFAHIPQSVSSISGEGSGTADSHGSTRSKSRTEARVPWYEYHKSSELTSVTFMSLEEQLYLKQSQLKRQPQQNAALLIPGQNVELMKTATLRNFEVPADQLNEFVHECWESAGYFQRPEDARQEILELEESLLIADRVHNTSSAEDRKENTSTADSDDVEQEFE